MNKLKSFTIIELVVVMLLSTMVMAIAYNGYTLFYKQFLSFRGSSARIADVSLIDRLICTDIADCNSVIKKDQGFECVFVDKVVKYQLMENYILRKFEAVQDTFPLELGNFSFSFLGKNSSDGDLIDEVVFVDINSKSQQKTFHYFKNYGADALINNREKQYGRN